METSSLRHSLWDEVPHSEELQESDEYQGAGAVSMVQPLHPRERRREQQRLGDRGSPWSDCPWRCPVPSSHRKKGLPEVWALPRLGEIEMKVAWVRPCDDGDHEGVLNVFQVGGRA